MKMFERSLYIFRRDLRCDDNTALRAALEQSQTVVPCFIFDQRQVGDQNVYRSDNAIQFMVESLQDLAQQLESRGGKLWFFVGIAEEVITQLIHQLHSDAIFFNKDYTPFSCQRDEAIRQACAEHGVQLHTYDDALVQPPDTVVTRAGTPYTIFTPFYRSARILATPPPRPNKLKNYFHGTVAGGTTHIEQAISHHNNAQLYVHGGRVQAKKILAHLSAFAHYEHTRDIPSESTSGLAAHLKFGTISVREVYAAIQDRLGNDHPLIRQLYWRDFFTQIAAHHPRVFGHAFHEQYDHIRWSESQKHFRAWCEGETGFPLVDAGMRQLNVTGFMHNRVRMVTASFLVKDLHIDWRWGERYFAQKLVDYDPAVNNGNWQWCASTGCDSQPYMRIFNPWEQQKRYDPECQYIKRWVPELTACTPRDIHNLSRFRPPSLSAYPEPIVDHAQERFRALEMYRACRTQKK